MATVSIIIPAYNYGHYLAEAIDSALSQTYPDVEVLVIDDGSTDDTADVCKRYRDKIRYHYKDNAGLSAARNTGIEKASGEYVVFLDADDALLPEMVETCMLGFEEDGEPLAVVAGRRQMMDAGGEVMMESKNMAFSKGGTLAMRDLVQCNRFAVDAAVVRRAAFERCGPFDVSLTSSEDRDMWIRMASQCSINLLDEPVVKVRVHPDSMSHHAGRMLENMTRVLAKARSSEAGRSLGFLYWARAFAYRDFQVAWIYYAEGRFAKAMMLIVSSFVRYPWIFDHAELGQPRFFRLRAFARFLLSFFSGRSRS